MYNGLRFPIRHNMTQKEIDLIDAKYIGKKMTKFRKKQEQLGNIQKGVSVCERRMGFAHAWLVRRESGERPITEEDLITFFIFGCRLAPGEAERKAYDWITEAMRNRLSIKK